MTAHFTAVDQHGGSVFLRVRLTDANNREPPATSHRHAEPGPAPGNTELTPDLGDGGRGGTGRTMVPSGLFRSSTRPMENVLYV
ncbi:unnamed protein product [Pleuronectes platessa]|uniref:Uncharacterized protein n=1 Tax=Pleuronectes platessa TaxID=8262 RepID=A0A9N7VD81_PLEPL|nr:unnamed protein product [Pleuronectes platessa]